MPIQMLPGIISQNVRLERSFSELPLGAQNVSISGTDSSQEKEP